MMISILPWTPNAKLSVPLFLATDNASRALRFLITSFSGNCGWLVGWQLDRLVRPPVPLTHCVLTNMQQQTRQQTPHPQPLSRSIGWWLVRVDTATSGRSSRSLWLETLEWLSGGTEPDLKKRIDIEFASRCRDTRTHSRILVVWSPLYSQRKGEEPWTAGPKHLQIERSILRVSYASLL